MPGNTHQYGRRCCCCCCCCCMLVCWLMFFCFFGGGIRLGGLVFGGRFGVGICNAARGCQSGVQACLRLLVPAHAVCGTLPLCATAMHDLSDARLPPRPGLQASLRPAWPPPSTGSPSSPRSTRSAVAPTRIGRTRPSTPRSFLRCSAFYRSIRGRFGRRSRRLGRMPNGCRTSPRLWGRR